MTLAGSQRISACWLGLPYVFYEFCIHPKKDHFYAWENEGGAKLLSYATDRILPMLLPRTHRISLSLVVNYLRLLMRQARYEKRRAADWIRSGMSLEREQNKGLE
ncbi:hypothetical protein TU87_22685 [Pseudomonas weihenstephanensis]|nr:hypothetical protein TU87_22685 [Pseudomonas weihenstephanensis]